MDTGESDGSSVSQPFLERTCSKRRLEPIGNFILHGAGQSAEAFRKYSENARTLKPAVYMSYLSLRGHHMEERFSAVIRELESYSDCCMLPQIGLSMTSDGYPEQHYEHLVARGDYDQNIDTFCRCLAKLNRPAYVRIGYEFNGQWNGYEPETYKAAWVRVATAIRDKGLDDVALVWCYAPDAKVHKEFMPFYPGDEYVDWWSIDLFSTWHFDAPESIAYVHEAQRRGFPVMIGESTARYVGVHDGIESWNAWFDPYFTFMAKYPSVKSFCYIDWDWAPYPMWKDWGDCRIEVNPLIAARYREMLDNPIFMHAAPRDELLGRLRREPDSQALNRSNL